MVKKLNTWPFWVICCDYDKFAMNMWKCKLFSYESQQWSSVICFIFLGTLYRLVVSSQVLQRRLTGWMLLTIYTSVKSRFLSRSLCSRSELTTRLDTGWHDWRSSWIFGHCFIPSSSLVFFVFQWDESRVDDRFCRRFLVRRFRNV